MNGPDIFNKPIISRGGFAKKGGQSFKIDLKNHRAILIVTIYSNILSNFVFDVAKADNKDKSLKQIELLILLFGYRYHRFDKPIISGGGFAKKGGQPYKIDLTNHRAILTNKQFVVLSID